MRKTFQFKLYQSKRNKYLHHQINIASEIYNHCIALHKQYYRLFGKSLNKYQLQKHLTKLKKRERYQYWRHLGSQAIQDITDRIDRAYKLFFNSLKTQRKISPPTFRKRIKYRSFCLKKAGYKLLEGNRVQINKRIFKYHKSREIDGTIKTLTVKRDPLGDIYLFFSCEVLEVKTTRIMTGKSAGFDFGLKTFLQPSDGSKPINSPEFLKHNIKDVKKASKTLSSKKKGSNNQQRARLNLARVHKRIANRRKDFHFKQTKQLAEKYDYIFFEDLNIRGMQMMWGRKVSDLGLYNFLRIQEYYCQKTGSVIGYVDRWFPYSQLCHICGFLYKDLSLIKTPQ